MKGDFHIGDWQVQPQANCVQKGGRTFHLEPKIMQVLVQLAAHPNEVLSKEQLIKTVWADTFVSDDVLTRSISEIRRVFDDDARAPRYIQTIPKTGYRLLMPVALDAQIPNHQPAVAPWEERPDGSPTTAAPMVAPRYSRGIWGWVVSGVLVLGILAAFWFLGRRGDRRSAGPEYKTLPLTSYLGTETQPAFSPDGNQIAFAWKDENGDHQHIYVKLLGAETPLKVTSDPTDDYSPTWSPDGHSIAFLRVGSRERGIYTVPAIGGSARKVFTPIGTIEWDRGALSWSPDGSRIIFPDGKSAKSPSAIYSLRLDTMQAAPITSPANLQDGDSSPSFSPDGSKIAFVRGTEGAVRDVFIMDANGGEPRQLTFDRRFVSGLAWTADSSAIVFSSDRGGKFSLWRISVAGGQPERLPVGGEDAFSPSIARRGDRLAYAQRSAKWSFQRVALKPSAQKSEGATRLLSSTQQDSAVRFSPDGSRIAFQSWRSGTQEIWLCTSSGTNLVRLTSFEGSLTGSPSWSPNGRQIAFDSRPKGRSHIYAIGVDGGVPHPLTDGDYNDIIPNWSQDGAWIYFGSNRSGSWQVWKIPSTGGEAHQVTTQGGFAAAESFDGKWMYFVKADAPGIWRMPTEGGLETQVVPQPAIGEWTNWGISREGIYFLNSGAGSSSIDFLNFATNRISHVRGLERLRTQISGLTVSPDDKWLLYTDLGEAGSRITLVENFR